MLQGTGQRRWPSVLMLAGVVVLAAIVGSASALVAGAHGGDGEQVHSCVNAFGRIRIVDASGECSPFEDPLDWNIQGLPGADGIDGADGAPGATNVIVVHGFSPTGSAVRVFCPEDSTVVGGGGFVQGTTSALMQNHPIDVTGANATTATLAGWQVAARNFEAPVQAFVLCATP